MGCEIFPSTLFTFLRAGTLYLYIAERIREELDGELQYVQRFSTVPKLVYSILSALSDPCCHGARIIIRLRLNMA